MVRVVSMRVYEIFIACLLLDTINVVQKEIPMKSWHEFESICA